MARERSTTGVERFFDGDEVIVSKTDLKGRMTYVNRVFMTVAGYREAELLGQPHSMIRHPDMPRCVFKLLWDTLQSGKEIFAYVINRCANGDHYWVFAHVTPSFGPGGEIVGYHSNRRVPRRDVIEQTIWPLYRTLAAKENGHGDRKQGMAASFEMLTGVLAEKGVDYDQFIFSL